MNYINTYKKGLDFLLFFFVILFFSWLILLIILAYLSLLQWPIFFTQRRIGKDNMPFVIFKFRTLSTNTSFSLLERKFALGTFLRFFHLDELPQIYNVMKGDMSFVGPRPLPVEYLPLFSGVEIRRHNVKPGITGLAQVTGGNSISWKSKFEYDLHYVENASLLLDLKIILKTLIHLFSFHEDVSLGESKFEGTH